MASDAPREERLAERLQENNAAHRTGLGTRQSRRCQSRRGRPRQKARWKLRVIRITNDRRMLAVSEWWHVEGKVVPCRALHPWAHRGLKGLSRAS